MGVSFLHRSSLRCALALAGACLVAAVHPRHAVAAKKGTLEIRCAVDGATVEVDGKSIGKTPMRPKVLSAGRHNLRVTKAGYVEFSDRISIQTGSNEKIVVNLTAKTGTARLEHPGQGDMDLAAIPLEPPKPAGKSGVIGGDLALEPLADLPASKPGSDLELEPLVQAEGKKVERLDASPLTPGPFTSPSVEEQLPTVRPWYLQWWAFSTAGAVVVGSVALAITMAGGSKGGPNCRWTLGQPMVCGG